MGKITIWSRVLVGLVALTLVACAGKPPRPTAVELTLSATADANGALPVKVRVYQLKSPTAFEEANFFQLAGNEGGVLGTDMLAKEEYFLTPGASQEIERELNPDTRYLGVVAEFADIDGANWRATAPVRANKTTEVTATIGAATVTVE